MNRDTVKKKLLQIISNDFLINNNALNDLDENQDVFSLLNFQPLDLVYLLNEVENVFNIKVCEKDLEDYGFLTVNNMIELILFKLQLTVK